MAIDLVPVVMGGGRPFFPGLPLEDIPLGDPEVCVPSARVTHLRDARPEAQPELTLQPGEPGRRGRGWSAAGPL